jgi:hypothetical protein
MPISQEVLSKYPNTIFLETGTYTGYTTAMALRCGFERVLTVELSDHWRDQYQTLFGNDDRVQLFAGLSKDRLPQMLAQVGTPATFWLDAHYFGGPSALGDKFCPLMEELDLIAGHWIKTHTILIDDVRCFGKEFGPEVTVEQVIKKLLTINPQYRFHFEDGRTQNDILVAAPPPAPQRKMRITAYPLSNHAVAITPQPNDRAWTTEIGETAAVLALSTAGGRGWDLLAPYAFEATWNGGPSHEDIDIRIETPNIDAPAFVQSFLGHGLLTFYPGYQIKTEGDQVLWVRGPINLPKDGLYPLECLVDAAVLPCTVTIHWQCTRPNHTIRFAADEPFATLLLCPKSAPENPTLDVVRQDADLDACGLAFEELADSAAVEDVFRRMGGDLRRQQGIHS